MQTHENITALNNMGGSLLSIFSTHLGMDRAETISFNCEHKRDREHFSAIFSQLSCQFDSISLLTHFYPDYLITI